MSVLPCGVYTWGHKNPARSDGIPTLITGYPQGTVIQRIACGDFHFLSVDTMGNVYGIGPNDRGQIGAPKGVGTSHTPLRIERFFTQSIVVKEVTCGLHHSTALTDMGMVYGWGKNEFGEANPLIPDDEIYEPTHIETLTEIARIYSQCASHCTIGVDKRGTAFHWGQKTVIERYNSERVGDTKVSCLLFNQPVDLVAVAYRGCFFTLADKKLVKGSNSIVFDDKCIEYGFDENSAITVLACGQDAVMMCNDKGVFVFGEYKYSGETRLHPVGAMSNADDPIVYSSGGFEHFISVSDSGRVYAQSVAATYKRVRRFGGNGSGRCFWPEGDDRSSDRRVDFQHPHTNDDFQRSYISDLSCAYYFTCMLVQPPLPFVRASTYEEDWKRIMATGKVLDMEDREKLFATAGMSGADCEFVVSGIKIVAHSKVIAERCRGSALSNLFESSTGDASSVPLDEDPVAMRALLLYLYTDHVTFPTMSNEEVISVLEVAEKYRFEHLQDLCEMELNERFLREEISAEICLDLIERFHGRLLYNALMCGLSTRKLDAAQAQHVHTRLNALTEVLAPAAE